jgi:hypothetical protein
MLVDAIGEALGVDTGIICESIFEEAVAAAMKTLEIIAAPQRLAGPTPERNER